jgi:hypothetical protein
MLRHRTHAIQTADGGYVEERDSRPRFLLTPSQVVSVIGGLALIVLGIIVVVKAGLSGSLNDPTVSVMGIQQTAAIGLGELGIGVLLVLCGLSPATRLLSGIIGLALVVFGIILLTGPSTLLADMRTESTLGWVGVIIGAPVLLASLVTPLSRDW